MSEEKVYRVVYRSKVSMPQHWTPWPGIRDEHQTLKEARASQLRLQELRGDCEVKVQSKPLPEPWADVDAE